MFFSSSDPEDLSFSNATNIIFQNQVLTLGSYYQVCWQLSDGHWWDVVQNVPVQGPYWYNMTMIPLMGHPFQVELSVGSVIFRVEDL